MKMIQQKFRKRKSTVAITTKKWPRLKLRLMKEKEILTNHSFSSTKQASSTCHLIRKILMTKVKLWTVTMILTNTTANWALIQKK